MCMAGHSYDYEELLADLADLKRKLQAFVRERAELQTQLRIARNAVTVEQRQQQGSYRELVELERVRAFDDVARGIEHDLYNALTPVEGYTELLLQRPERLADPIQARAYLNAILAASKDARNTIDRMREFYYSSASVDIEHHGSVSRVLAKALANESGRPTSGDAQGSVEVEHGRSQSLSPREWDVLRLLSEGLKNREIAETLVVSENTVKTHIKAILSKLSLKNRTQAAAYALLDNRAYPGEHVA
ncbi:MAG: response regulator transcription factor [Dehalococcoidia bacterium]